MKRFRVQIMIGLLALTVIGGCSKEKKEEPPVVTEGEQKEDLKKSSVQEKSTTEEKGIEELRNNVYVFGNQEDDSLAAMCFCGVNNKEKDEKFEKFLTKYQLKKDNFDVVIDVDDAEWFVIVPKYEGTSIQVDQVQLNEDGELKVVNTLTTTKQPILLGCNYSDIVPSVKVKITYKEESIEFSPFISLENGKPMEEERILAIPEL